MMNCKSKFLNALLIMLFFIPTSLAQTIQDTIQDKMQVTMLNSLQKSVVPIAAYTANGNMEGLNISINSALDQGVTINEIKEVIVHTYAYAGFPRSLNGLAALMQILEKRKAEGIVDVMGEGATINADARDMVVIGTDIQTEVVGQVVTGKLYEFSPEIDIFLKSHLFGDIFSRDVLDYKTREVATIAILATLPGLEAQLKAHFSIGMQTGLTQKQLEEIVAILSAELGADVGNRAKNILAQVL